MLVIDSVEVGENPFLTIKPVWTVTLSKYCLEVGMAIGVCRGGLESDVASLEQ